MAIAPTNTFKTPDLKSAVQWGWNYGLTKPVVASPFANETNYFNKGMASVASAHWTIAIESENAPGASAPGPICQSFPITDITKAPGANPGVATFQTAPHGAASLSVNLKTDLYQNAQPAGPGYFTWYAFGENIDLGGGPLPAPNMAEFEANLLYGAWLPNASARVSVDYQGWWNGQSFQIEIDLNRQGNDWGVNSGKLVQNVQRTAALTFVQINGAALGLSLIPGIETHVHVDWGSLLQTLIDQGTIAAPVGGWLNSSSQAFYVSTELENHAATHSGTTDVWINGFGISGTVARDSSAMTQIGGDTMYSVVPGSAGSVQINSRTGDIVQTLPPTPSGSMQFVTVDAITFGANLASARSLGLDPSQLRDYDGNPLGGSGQWEMKGLASVQPGSAPSYILTNAATGRWAEVAAQPGGTIDFHDNGNNGHTRIAGIYIDPLVAAGIVAVNSDDNSQTRFLADIKANRLDLVGSVYDQQNGGMDLMFKLTNSAGVNLRAVLFPDGNIQYANYMTANQLTQWATSVEISSAVYGKWVTPP